MMTTRRFYILLSIGLLITSSDFILKRYITMTDFGVGVLKGTGVGLMIVCLFLMSKAQKKA